ncbi:DUF4132 domain-containing protein [Glaciecola sp. MH2013]|uniref:DUF4132 domain-containing protein n=1 Tax=Glaciecola sp. MH2013 TaxID=2785524 RepID=UPI00189D6FC6|nr:DUF4132 domain-containing protein [Glaciecola sp. MH2013]MBF7073991.1 DUF4132 domain-containing protein [Glaciecola sp. MH2013]
MLTLEQAEEILSAKSKINFKNESFAGFSHQYQILGKLITQSLYLRNYEEINVVKTYQDAFGKNLDINPWQSKEGKKLGLKLFGQLWSSYIPDLWDLIFTLPYQQHFYRRSYRIAKNEIHINNAIMRLRDINIGACAGFRDCSFVELVRLLPHYPHHSLSYLITLALKDKSNEPALETVVTDIINNEDELGAVSRDLLKALLLSEDKKHWHLVGRLLLAAQRQEGLRQSILESTDETNVSALKYFIDLILEHDLSRFSSVIRAVDAWFGFGWEAAKKKTVTQTLRLAQRFLECGEEREEAFTSKNNLDAYVAYWAEGVFDAVKAVNKAYSVIASKDAAKHNKLVALFFISSTEQHAPALVDYMLENWGEDIEIDYWLLENTPPFNWQPEFFDKVRQSADALPSKGKRFGGDVFEWQHYEISPAHFYSLLVTQASEEQLQILASNITRIPSEAREQLMRKIFPKHFSYGSYDYLSTAKDSAKKSKDRALNIPSGHWQRALIYQAIKDRNMSVMYTGLSCLSQLDISQAEFSTLVDLLARQNKELRASLLKILLNQKQDDLIAVTDNLLSASNVNQRLAGLEILTSLDKKDLAKNFVDQKIEQFKSRASFSKNEEVLLAHFEPKATNAYTLENAFGVVDFSKVRPLIDPQPTLTPKKSLSNLLKSSQSAFINDFVDAKKIVKQVNALYELLEQHRDVEFTCESWRGETNTYLVANNCSYTKHDLDGLTPQEKYSYFALAEVWERWYREAALNDYEMFYACTYVDPHGIQHHNSNKLKDFVQSYYPNLSGIKLEKTKEFFYHNKNNSVKNILSALASAFCDQQLLSVFCIECVEDMVACCPSDLKTINLGKSSYWQENKTWVEVITNSDFFNFTVDIDGLINKTPDMALRYYDLCCYLFSHRVAFPSPVKSFENLLATSLASKNFRDSMRVGTIDPIFAIKLYNKQLLDADNLILSGLFDRQMLEILNGQQHRHQQSLKGLNLPSQQMQALKHRLLEVELARGDLKTEATAYINWLTDFTSYEYMLEALTRLGKESFDRGYSYHSDSKKVSFSHILVSSSPAKEETFEQFSRSLDEAALSKSRLVELACYATQWADWIGRYLKIDNFTKAVWWFHAHASDYSNARKETEIARYSSISIQDFRNGAIDIDWFNQVYTSLGKSNWKLFHEAAKYISDGNGHRQVKLYSSVMLGEVKITETTKKVIDKRDKDYLRALGLIPLSKTVPEKDLLKRYNLIQTFLKESKQFGAQRQESERIACEIALDNLARNAGYDDRVRFEWAMEGKATQAIMDKAQVEFDDVSMSLCIDEHGKAQILVQKGDKTQKSIPAKYKKDKKVQSLKDGKTYLTKQYARTRDSLENAMLREDVFSRNEIEKIMQHPIVKVMLGKIVLFNQSAQSSGFYQDGELVDAKGQHHKIDETDKLVIAHSAHLQHIGLWSDYQAYLFEHKISQVFKQVFRELYILTDDEKERGNRSERYQGYQVQPAQTVALLRRRGWTVSYEEGLQKVFHKHGFMATIYAMADWFSPADIEAPTIEYVSFHSLKDYTNIPLKDIPPVIFSEVMRDLDLVVSVAHVGQVDPEASHSTMQMRAVLAKESARLFKLNNVEVKERHIVIKGSLAEYSLHLGSARVQRRGLDLNIIAVQSQHRGRVFLPFVDDDPKSAELISKMKLLAEDNKIQDPTILSQINK